MFVRSELQQPNDKAVLISKNLERTDGCSMSLWYHVLGENVGELNIYQQ